MIIKNTKRLLACSILMIGTSGVAIAADDIVSQAPIYGSVAFWGGEVGHESYIIYGGFVKAFNGNIGTDGFLGRVTASFGSYEYDTLAVAPGSVDLDATSIDVMLGYQTYRPGYLVSIYAGFDYRDNDLSPNDPGNPASGGEAGAKVQFEARTTDNAAGFAGLLANYSTAHDNYFVRGRLGMNHSGLTFGPEGVLLGDESYDGYKVGGFVSGLSLGDLDMTVNAGYQSSEGDAPGSNDDSGFYAGVSFSTLF